MSATVYLATIADGRQYVGLTRKSLEVRRLHWGGSKRGTGKIPPVGCMWEWAVNCCGRDNIELVALSTFDDELEARGAERAAIVRFNTRVPFGFNKSPGGGGMRPPWSNKPKLSEQAVA